MSGFATTATLPTMRRGPLKRQSSLSVAGKARRGFTSGQGFTSGISRNPRSARRSSRLAQLRGPQQRSSGGVAKRADPAYFAAIGDIAPTDKSTKSKRKTWERLKMAGHFKVPVQIRRSSRLAATAAMKAQYSFTSDEPSPLRGEASVQKLGAKLGDRTLGKKDRKLQGDESITKAILPAAESSATTKLQFTIDPELVLDEFIKLTQDLTDSERLNRSLKLPNIAIGYFDESGGKLSVDEYDVHLAIPCGAIPKSTCQLVYVYVNPTAPLTDGVDPKEVALSPSVKCGPEGLKFEEEVVLSFCHHNALFSEKCSKLAVRMRHEGSTKTQWEAFDGNTVVTEEKVILLVEHFTLFSLFGTPPPDSFKRLKIGAFGGVLETHCRQYAFRIHVWDDEKNAEKNVMQMETRMESIILDAFRDFLFFLEKGDLTVKVSDLKNGWVTRGTPEQIIYEGKVKLLSSNSVTFNLKKQGPSSPEDAGLYCIALTHQSQSNEDERRRTEVRLAICPRQGAVGGSQSQNIKEYIQQGVHGHVDHQDYGGLSAQAVNRLCVHLDTAFATGTNRKHFLEKLLGSSIQAAEISGTFRTKQLLKVYFKGHAKDGTLETESINELLELLQSMNMETAVEIINEDLRMDVD